MAKVDPSQINQLYLSEQDLERMNFDRLFIDDYIARAQDTETVVNSLNLTVDDVDSAQESIGNIDTELETINTTLGEANGDLVGTDDAATDTVRGVMYKGELVNDAVLPPAITPPAPAGAPATYDQAYTQGLADDIVTNANNIDTLKTAIDDLVGVVNDLLESMRNAGQIDE